MKEGLYPIGSFLSLSFRLRSPIQPACLTYQPTYQLIKKIRIV
nr:MAG TPA: hypothetical protein [Caudoviricetes sp.]